MCWQAPERLKEIAFPIMVVVLLLLQYGRTRETYLSEQSNPFSVEIMHSTIHNGTHGRVALRLLGVLDIFNWGTQVPS